MKYSKYFTLYFVAFLFIAPINVKADGDVGLIDLMRNFQYFMHKAGLSIRGGNAELADFYMHEIEENLEQVAKIEEYDGHPVGQLSVRISLYSPPFSHCFPPLLRLQPEQSS